MPSREKIMTFDESFIDWLLEAQTPTIRFLTLSHLQERDEADPEVQNAHRDIMETGPVPTILTGQTKAGNWYPEHSYYTPKYVSTHWSMMLLAELNADGSDERLVRGVDYMLTATRDELAKALDNGEYSLSCFWGNLLRYALHCGFNDDPRVEAIVRYLALNTLDEGWRCRYNDELPCAWGAARSLWGLAILPAGNRSVDSVATIDQGLDFLLSSHQLVEADYPTSGHVHTLWSRLNFPLFYQADILFILRVVAELGALDHSGVKPAMEWLIARRKLNGRWRGSSPFRQRTWQGLADVEETNRWVSLQAALIIQQDARRFSNDA